MSKDSWRITMPKVIRVDIDGTICKNNGDFDYVNAEPLYERIEKINKLCDDGNIIIYWTSRGKGIGIDLYKFTHAQLVTWGCKFHALEMDKPFYHLFVDDKNINSEAFFEETDNS
jgi:hypothetical protein